MNLIINSPLYGSVGVIPYPVRDGATEALEFYTDVIQSMTNEAEERAKLRALPRQMLKYQLAASFGYQQEISNALKANLRGRWLVPMWFEAQRMYGVVGQQTYPVDTVNHDIRPSTHALIFKSICEWQIVQVYEIGADYMFADPSHISGDMYVIPLRVGKLSGNVNGAPTGYNNAFQLQYWIEDVLSGLDLVPPQYNGQDFYDTPYLMEGGNGSTRVEWDEQQNDFVVGSIASYTDWKWSAYSRSYAFDGAGPLEYSNLKRWFYRRAGKLRGFYSPTFESDLQKRQTGTITNTFRFKDEGYADSLFNTLKRVGFRLHNGTWQVRTVIAVASAGAGLSQITLSSPLNVNASDVELASFVLYNRLNTDRLEISLGQNGRFTSSASVIEIED